MSPLKYIVVSWPKHVLAACAVSLLLVTAAPPAHAQLLSGSGLLQEPDEPVVGPALSELLDNALLDRPVEAVLTFDSTPSALVITAIKATGVDTVSFQVLPMVGVRGSLAQLLDLLTLPDLRSAYLNRKLRYFLDESAPLIGAPEAWHDLGVTGRGVGVAVLDSGIDATHPDLPFGSRVVENVKIASVPFTDEALFLEGVADSDTSSGHGTHVASIAGGSGAASDRRYRGIAPGADIVGLGAGEAIFVLSALQGFDWILQNHDRFNLRVVNNSWGATGDYSPDDPVNVASRAVHDAGMSVVFAAGNDGPDADTLNAYCAPWSICVAAARKDGQTLADFSSRGVAGDPSRQPTLTAPGVAIAAARASSGVVMNTFFAVDVVELGADAVYYTAADGTSMAAPHVAGTAALMLEANPLLKPDEVKTLLVETAAPMFAYAPHEAGAGLVDAAAAVRAAHARAGM